ncbi:MAG TPA: N-acetylmuramoyl-L-alanine amidase, partial [Pirellulaceae bacterium]
PREYLSADGLVPLGTQPLGGLTGKVVYIHAGHGWTADNLGNGAWSTQRGETFEMVEDLGNHDQMNFLADYLYRSGATVVPLRPVGNQRNEVILDNDSPQVTYEGSWSNSTASVYYGDPGDVPYRFTTTTATETAYARYRPNLPAAGFYPVYTWVLFSSNRDAKQLYRVRHAGGTTEVNVNHQRVGNGPVYLGSYYFNAGTEGYVDVSNRSATPGSITVADMIRFGNGMGDITRGGPISNQPREDEAGLYWVKWHVDRSEGIPDSEYRASTDDGSATVSLSPRYSEYMNNATNGSLSDRVFVSYHSNAGVGTSRGVLGLYNGNNDPDTRTPNQFLLANTLGREINDDLVDQAGIFEHDWDNNTTVTLDRSDIEFGEINNLYINDEFDATIIETGYHDNQQDAEMLRDARVRDAIARATYQGLIRYFRAVDGNATPLTMLPGQVTNVRAESLAAGQVRISWTPPAVNDYNGDSAASYRIYTSFNGYGFDGGTIVAGGGTSQVTLSGLDPANGVHYFRVVAENVGGQSAPSEVVAALPTGNTTKVLIVNGFDRLERNLNPRQTYFGGVIDRVKPRLSNSFDYAALAGAA